MALKKHMGKDTKTAKNAKPTKTKRKTLIAHYRGPRLVVSHALKPKAKGGRQKKKPAIYLVC